MNKTMRKLKIWLGGTDPKILGHPLTWFGFLVAFVIAVIGWQFAPESPIITRYSGFLFIYIAFIYFIRGISMVVSKKIRIRGIYKQKKGLAVLGGIFAIAFSSCLSFIGLYLLITGKGLQ